MGIATEFHENLSSTPSPFLLKNELGGVQLSLLISEMSSEIQQGMADLLLNSDSGVHIKYVTWGAYLVPQPSVSSIIKAANSLLRGIVGTQQK